MRHHTAATPSASTPSAAAPRAARPAGLVALLGVAALGACWLSGAGSVPATAAPASHPTAGMSWPGTSWPAMSWPAHRGGATYTWERAAPRRLPDGSANRLPSTAAGIDDDGNVVGDADGGVYWLAFRGSGRGQWLDVSGLRYGADVASVSPAGHVAGHVRGNAPGFVLWSGDGSRRSVAAPESYYGARPSAVNSSGVIAGSTSGVKTGALFYGSAAAVTQVPNTREGNFTVTGISEAGLAVGTRDQPHYRNDGHYPEGVTFTAAGITPIRSDSSNATTTVDAISPDGRYVVGRVGGDPQRPGVASWVSTSRAPVALSGAQGLRPRDVSDSGVVVGSVDGRAVTWSRGRLRDLTSLTRRLPRGWVLTDAVAVDESGDLAVNARDAQGAAVALKLSRR